VLDEFVRPVADPVEAVGDERHVRERVVDDHLV